MPFHDLNLLYSTNHAELSRSLAFHAELGYSVVAISIQVTGKLLATPQLVPVSDLTIPKSINALTRLTLTISDTSQNHRLASLQPHYNIIALRPTTEKSLQLCCNSLECDLISLDLSQRLPFILRFKTVASALQRGIRFEICYSNGVTGGNDARRNLISGAVALIRATRGRGIILSSEAKNALGLRGPYDVINLAQVWGLGQERGKEALCEEVGKVVRLATLKRTSFRGVIDIVQDTPIERSNKTKDNTITTDEKQEVTINGHNHQATLANGIKRKASTSSLEPSVTTVSLPEKPLSKREMKRRAKKAKVEARTQNEEDTDHQSNGFAIKHEALLSPKKKS